MEFELQFMIINYEISAKTTDLNHKIGFEYAD